ncbi:MAG TPA: hypothetical protein VF444_09870 [Pseudonocardiaceae bacterium]
MTNPGQQWAQQAAQQANQQAQRNADALFRRNAADHDRYLARRRQASAGPTGVFGVLGRLVGLVVALAIIAIAVGIFVVILNAAEPGWFGLVQTWFQRIF